MYKKIYPVGQNWFQHPNLDRSAKPPLFLTEMIEASELGVKSGKEFNDYTQKNIQESMKQKESATFKLLMMMQQYD